MKTPEIINFTILGLQFGMALIMVGFIHYGNCLQKEDITSIPIQKKAVAHIFRIAWWVLLWTIVSIISCAQDYYFTASMIAFYFFFINIGIIIWIWVKIFIPSYRKYFYSTPFNWKAKRYHSFMCERTSDFFLRHRKNGIQFGKKNLIIPPDLCQAHCNDCGWMVILNGNLFDKFTAEYNSADVDTQVRLMCSVCYNISFRSRYEMLETSATVFEKIDQYGNKSQ